jgi:hypothetical protein
MRRYGRSALTTSEAVSATTTGRAGGYALRRRVILPRRCRSSVADAPCGPGRLAIGVPGV